MVLDWDNGAVISTLTILIEESGYARIYVTPTVAGSSIASFPHSIYLGTADSDAAIPASAPRQIYSGDADL